MRKNRIANLISIIVLSILLIASLGLCIYLLLHSVSLRRDADAAKAALSEIEAAGYVYEADAQVMVSEAAQAASTEAEARTREQILSGIQARLESGEGTTSVIRRLYPDKLVVADSGRFFFLPIAGELPGNPFLESDWATDQDGRMQYVGSDTAVHVRQGIDVSRFQGNIDWSKVAADGIEFAIIRVGYRGTSEGKLVEDERFKDNIEDALAAGLDVGVYVYSQAISETEAREEAQFVLDLIEPYDVTGPVVIDIEAADSAGARTADMSRDSYTRVAATFCALVEGAGYRPMIYGNLKTYALLLSPEELADYPIWYAYYSEPLYFPYAFDIWQYSSTGRVRGVDGDVDMNVEVTFE